MAGFHEFRKGMHVVHLGREDGVVEEVTDSLVVVEFTHGWKGKFDRNWFRIHPDMLRPWQPNGAQAQP